jgi:putative transposase
MRFPRVKAEGQSFYHCLSRTVEGRFIFQSSGGSCLEAEKFIALMRRLEAFSGVRVLTYVLMANHFHVLCEVPEPRALSQSEVLERIEAGYGPQRVQALRAQLARYAEQPDSSVQSQRLLEPYRRRMNDISIFFKELKGRFAQWYNRRHGRYGALWAERFKSLLVEPFFLAVFGLLFWVGRVNADVVHPPGLDGPGSHTSEFSRPSMATIF